MSYFDRAGVERLMTEALRDAGWGAQSSLARDVGVTTQTANKWASGQTVPDPRHWDAIEAHFEWEPGTIARHAGIGGPPTTPPKPADNGAPEESELTPEGIHLAALAGELDPDERALLVAMAEKLLAGHSKRRTDE